MHPYEFMFFAGVVLAFLLVAAFWWFVEEFWWLLLIVLIVVAIAYCKRGFENEKWLKSIQATEIMAINGIQTEVYAHTGYSVGPFGHRTNYYQRTVKETGRMITFKVYYRNGMIGRETVKEGTYTCNVLNNLVDKSKKPWGMDITPIFRDHEEW